MKNIILSYQIQIIDYKFNNIVKIDLTLGKTNKSVFLIIWVFIYNSFHIKILHFLLEQMNKWRKEIDTTLCKSIFHFMNLLNLERQYFCVWAILIKNAFRHTESCNCAHKSKFHLSVTYCKTWLKIDLFQIFTLRLKLFVASFKSSVYFDDWNGTSRRLILHYLNSKVNQNYKTQFWPNSNQRADICARDTHVTFSFRWF